MPAETALVTGASSGIGEQLARLFAADGSHLVLVARSEDKLRALAEELRETHGVSVHVIAADLSDPHSPRHIVDRLEVEGVVVDVLVNNAGFGARGSFVELERERQLDMMRVNMMSLADLTYRLLPGMLDRGRGGVLNIGSTAAFQPGPNMAIYYATKAFVLSFTEALAVEVADAASGVHISCLCPGATDTGFEKEADMGGTWLFSLGVMDAAKVARAGYRGWRAGKVVVVPGIKNKLTAQSSRFMPRWLVRRIVKRLQ